MNVYYGCWVAKFRCQQVCAGRFGRDLRRYFEIFSQVSRHRGDSVCERFQDPGRLLIQHSAQVADAGKTRQQARDEFKDSGEGGALRGGS